MIKGSGEVGSRCNRSDAWKIRCTIGPYSAGLGVTMCTRVRSLFGSAFNQSMSHRFNSVTSWVGLVALTKDTDRSIVMGPFLF